MAEDPKKQQRDLIDQEIEQLLKSNNIVKKLSAVDMLLERNQLDRLLSLLKSESWHLRIKAQEALSNYTLEELKEKLLPLLEEKLWFVRAAALNVLANLSYKKFRKENIHMEKESESKKDETEIVARELDPEIKEMFEIFYNHLKEKNEVVRTIASKGIAYLTMCEPEVKQNLSGEEIVLIENQLREAKEFELLRMFESL